ncbi:NAD(P)/FAD-dependent oxidoreductase [Tumebacillus sp. ITR2]|uniref:NAD(P)/FAD-dependent oxidoreductase n=1 Tax=Tumebacillus amylolyticus TaxID=2801339 RepID=A0ABS1J9H1_9BACL|nr:NAD(P)/FAD-dependent oxidoreductase [Tumebacillus amylolyticus]MBL0386926.1 NAD(P)/FAD-dependent oxidoreductase [Tumebacillus amylolyticus]
MERWDVVVIGGGLSGLTAAVYLAKQGLRTLVLEQSSRWGGRGATDEREGSLFNIGPHALSNQGQGRKILQELGLDPDAGEVVLGGRLVTQSGVHGLPVSALELLKTTAFSFREKIELARVMGKVSKAVPEASMQLTLAEWVEQNARHENVRKFLYALFRLGSYSNAPTRVSAGVCLRQFQVGGGGVRYLHGGWQAMVDSLADKARSAGAVLRTEQKVIAISGTHPEMKVVLADGREIATQHIVAAINPQVAHQLTGAVPNSHLAKVCKRLIPVLGAALDVSLRRLPDPNTDFALHLDRPYYYSNHSSVARLTRDDRHVVLHLFKYLSPDDTPDAARDRAELEGFLDLLQPGWKNEVITSRFLPRIAVTYGLQTVERVGSHEPENVVPDIPGLFLAGDWTVCDAMLADAAFVSGKETAQRILSVAIL